jgi:hypothetical protein
VNVIRLAVDLEQLRFEVAADLPENFLHGLEVLLLEDVLSVFGHENQVNMKVENTMAACSDFCCF